jgi:hypothetical protein
MVKPRPTVTVQVLEVIADPSVDVAVICAVPVETPVTTPEALTAAMLGLLEVQLRAIFVALPGVMAGTIVVVDPTETETVAGREI